MADYLSKYPVGKSLQMLKEDIRMFKFMRIVLYTKKRIWMLTRLSRPMKGSLQIVFRKADK